AVYRPAHVLVWDTGACARLAAWPLRWPVTRCGGAARRVGADHRLGRRPAYGGGPRGAWRNTALRRPAAFPDRRGHLTAAAGPQPADGHRAGTQRHADDGCAAAGTGRAARRHTHTPQRTVGPVLRPPTAGRGAPHRTWRDVCAAANGHAHSAA